MTDLITTPFGFDSTAAQVIDGIDLSGKRAIVTGGSSGIGVETARALASSGADVTFAAGWTGPLHLLVNNAGVMALPDLQLSHEGWELQFATNHLGHFALTLGLHDALAAAGHARIVSLSSVGHLRSPVIFDDLNFTSHPYNPQIAYGQAKAANVLSAVEATRRWSADGITANAVHPGAIADTNPTRHMDPKILADLVASGTYTFKSTEQGAATSVLVATSPQLEGIGGRYFEDCHEATVVEPGPDGGASGVPAYAVDPDNARRLWDVSEDLIKR